MVHPAQFWLAWSMIYSHFSPFHPASARWALIGPSILLLTQSSEAKAHMLSHLLPLCSRGRGCSRRGQRVSWIQLKSSPASSQLSQAGWGATIIWAYQNFFSLIKSLWNYINDWKSFNLLISILIYYKFVHNLTINSSTCFANYFKAAAFLGYICFERQRPYLILQIKVLHRDTMNTVNYLRKKYTGECYLVTTYDYLYRTMLVLCSIILK